MSANPVLVVRDSLDEHIADLKDERNKCISRLTQLNNAIAIAESLKAIVPSIEKVESNNE